jgi:hypothetical protein
MLNQAEHCKQRLSNKKFYVCITMLLMSLCGSKTQAV